MSESFVSAGAVVLAAARPFSFFWGIVVPGAIFALSFALTWMLYRKFARGRH
jgi:hypothetical protein